jgi:hypothetical protein
MAKCKIGFILICCTLICSGVFSQDSIREKLIETYTEQIGVREATGNNDGFMVEQYQASTGLDAKNFPWCAAMVTYCHLECGLPVPPAPAWSPSWFKDSVLVYKRDRLIREVPQSGDVFGIWFQNKKRIAHVGFIDDWQNGSKFCVTVEGNTNKAGSREGDGVYRKKRLKRQIYAISRHYK